MGTAHLGDDLNDPLVDVFERGPVAVVVEVDLDQRLRVLRQARENVEDERLLFDGGRSHLENGEEDLVEQDLDLFLQKVKEAGNLPSAAAKERAECVCRRRRTFILPRKPFKTFQKISTQSSKTWPTGLTAFRLRLRQRYCLVACTNVARTGDDEGMRM